MERQFVRLGLIGTSIEAVTPDRVPATMIGRLATGADPRPSTAVELACTMSHKAAWEAFLALDLPAVVVLEDDAILSSRLPEFLGLLEGGLPTGIDVLKFETVRTPARLSSTETLELGSFRLRRLLGTHYGSCGYVLSRQMARAAVADPRLETAPIDAYLFSRLGPTIYERRVFQVTPALSMQLSVAGVAQKLAESSIEASREASRPKRSPSRGRRTLENIRLGLRDVRHFHSDLSGMLGPRSDIPFEP